MALPKKKRLCIDYSQTINQYTEVDAYPLPRIDDMITNLAKYRVFSDFDLRMLIINSRYAILIRNILGLKHMVGYISPPYSIRCHQWRCCIPKTIG